MSRLKETIDNISVKDCPNHPNQLWRMFKESEVNTWKVCPFCGEKLITLKADLRVGVEVRSPVRDKTEVCFVTIAEFKEMLNNE